MEDISRKVAQVVAAIRLHWSEQPRVGLVLGSGLGSLANRIIDPVAIDYTDLPHFAQATALGHEGRLVCGWLRGYPVIAMQGRLHGYEGHPADRIAFPIRVMRALGIERLLVSNAAGGLNPQYQVGEIMVIDDHLNLTFRNPLVGANNSQLEPRWPDMSSPYDAELVVQAQTIARQQGFVCHRGVYVAMLGPTYETRAEYRMLRRLGGDVVGMSTAAEVIVAAQLGLRVLGLSTVTNVCSPDQLDKTTGEAVVAAAESASEKVRTIIEGIIAAIPD